MEDVNLTRGFSQMTREELQAVMDQCKHKGQIAFDEDRINELLVQRTRYYLAASYLLNPADFRPGDTYYVEGEDGLFTISSTDGIMAHGIFETTNQHAAFPIAMLTKQTEHDN